MAYTWDKKLIKKLYQNPEVRQEFENDGLIASYFGFLDIWNSIFFSIKQTLIEDGNFLYENNFIEPILTDLNYQTRFEFIPIGFFEHKLSKEDIMNLTASFYGTLDDELYSDFRKAFDNRYNHFRFASPINSKVFAGSTFHSFKTNETFIVSCYEKTAYSLMATIHEYAHALAFIKKDGKAPILQSNLFREIESHFMELIAMDFFEENFPHLKEDIDAVRYDFYQDLLHNATNVQYKIDFDEILYHSDSFINEHNTLYILKKLKEELGLTYKDIRNILKIPAEILCAYPIGALYAIELYNIYKQNPKEALELYKQIIIYDADSNNDNYQELKKMGINPPEHVLEFERKLTKH